MGATTPASVGAALRTRQRLERELVACRDALAMADDIEERFRRGADDPIATATMQGALAQVGMTGPDVSATCRAGVCRVDVISRGEHAFRDPVADRLDDLDTGAFVLGRSWISELTPRSMTRTFLYQRDLREDSMAWLTEVLDRLERRLRAGVAGCPHGDATLQLEVRGERVHRSVDGDLCLAPIVDELVSGMDATGRRDGVANRRFVW